MKTQEVPQYLREFNKIFSELEYRHSAHTVWTDFLELCICGLSYGSLEARCKEIFARYREEEHKPLWELFEALLRIYGTAKKDNEWIDPLGDYYEILSGKGHKQWFGQFFTPPTVCDAMVQMTVGNVKPMGAKNFDPACGSGRLLLSFNHFYPNNFQFGCDLDRTCVMMTAINLCLHEAQGEVCWKDSLDITDHRLVYAINLHTVNGVYLPNIIEIPKEESFIYACDMELLNRAKVQMVEEPKGETKVEEEEEPKAPPQVKTKKEAKKKAEQTSLF